MTVSHLPFAAKLKLPVVNALPHDVGLAAHERITAQR
jgi:hypothetical protein